MYVTIELDQFKSDPDQYRDKCVRIRLKGGRAHGLRSGLPAVAGHGTRWAPVPILRSPSYSAPVVGVVMS